MKNARAWLLASRPKTLPAAFVPVVVGASLAYAEGAFDLLPTLAAAVCAVLIQIGTNFTNDLYDKLRGADAEDRIGPSRAMNDGLVSERAMRIAVGVTFGAAFLVGGYLIYIGGLPIFAIGVASILAGAAYTAGPFPLAYRGLGDLFVLLFFGFVGTMGTYYVNALEFSALSALAAAPVGALVTNILVVNNYRDVEQDRRAGKNTLVVLWGKKFARFEYVGLLGASFLVPLIMFFAYDISAWIFLPYLTLPFAYKLVTSLFTLSGAPLNRTLELTAKFSLAFGALLSIGIAL
ncbi:MAG: 1,4-dihydroxy-2-naphthoate polyprenyltransferase [Ignavibacteriales bacterium]|nr:1,4-dihydroxy-2-naphthoate polyprenyltransferase [Ignavibacteriales bacterium]